MHPKTKINSGIMADECVAILQEFFRNLREE